MISKFNVRVYFVLFSKDHQSILLSDEIIRGQAYTKFPGGGLEFGEGPIDCVKREALEELGQEVEVIGHLYTSDFFIPSAFHPTDQVISIYYAAKLKEEQQFISHSIKHQFKQTIEDEESFRWVRISELSANDVDFPADKKIIELLINFLNGSNGQ